MSQENVATVHRIYAAMNLSVPGSVSQLSAPRESWRSLIDPDIEWRGPREFPDLAEPVFGHEGIVAYAAKVAEALDDYRMTPEQFIDANDRQVLVFSREGGRGKISGAEVETHPTAHLWTLRDGLAVRMQSYWEREDALKAAGVSE
jgi:ketosteroid isomerase-like protein